ncbi:MAG: hypothetical protein JSU73_12530, partial [candidate division WOR-3 bacterium]
AGGIMLAWVKIVSLDSSVLLLQVVDSSGRRLQGIEGRAIASQAHYFWWGGLFPMDDSNVLVVWTTSDSGIRAQKVNRNGEPQWQAGGVAVCDEPHDKLGAYAAPVPDGTVIAWSDLRHGTWDVFAQKLNPDGTRAWAGDGVPVCVAQGRQGGMYCDWFEPLRAVTHAGSRVTVAWYDQRPGRTGISCQSIDANGERRWDTLGIEVGTIVDRDTLFTDLWFGFDADTNGGAVVTWPRLRERQRYDILAQKVDSLGQLRWGNGLDICEYTGHWLVPRIATTSDGMSGAIGCWSDLRFGWPNWSIYAQRCGDAVSAVVAPSLVRPEGRGSIYPNPCVSGTRMVLNMPAEGARVTILDVSGRVVGTCGAAGTDRSNPGDHIVWDGKDEAGHTVPGGVYVVRLDTDLGSRYERLVLLR